MFLEKVKELILRGEFSEVLELLKELEDMPSNTLLDELEIVTLQFIVQRHLRNYSTLTVYFEPLKDLYEKIAQEYPKIKELWNCLNDLFENKITLDSFYESTKNLSSVIRERLPVLLFIEIHFSVRRQTAFFFPLNHVELLKFSSIFEEYNDHIFYSELLILATWFYLYKWENRIALDLANTYLRICKEKNDCYGVTLSYGTIASIYADMGNCREAIDYSFEYLKHAEELGILNIIWHAYFALALHHAYADDLKNALKYDNKCSELEQHPNFSDILTTSSRKLITVHINLKKGDVDLALRQMLEMLEKSENFMNLYTLAMAYGVVADVYSQKNEYEHALEYYHKGLEIREQFGGYTIVANNYFHIFEINLQLGLEKNALKFLEKLRKLNEETDEILVNNLCSFSEALYLKSKNDDESKAKAKKILTELVSTESPYHKTTDRSYLHLCDSILEEFKTSENMALVQTLHNYIKELTLKATLANSNLLLTELYFLQSKILLLDLKVEEAINLLEQALSLAQEKGLNRLAILLSNEYDLLLQQLDKWDEFSSYLPTLDERLELTHIEDLVNRMMRKWVNYGIVSPEIESPQYFVILSKEGANIFAESFPSSVFESEIIAEILFKMDKMKIKLKTTQVFLRFRYKQYSCLLSKEQDLFFCYIFMGKSYVPANKFRRFFKFLIESDILDGIKQKWTEDKKISIDSRIQLSTIVEESFLIFNESN
ncbi:MAG: tetratricopeptide repeat protein [Candidatus Heimdallarchaeaceae archaeon]